MRFVSRDFVFSVLILVLLFATTCLCSFVKTENKIKSAVFLSPKFELGPGSVINRYFYDIDFPKGQIAVKSFDSEVVDEAGNSVPLHETYLHHWLVARYYQPKHVTRTALDSHRMLHESNLVLVKNNGLCQGSIFRQYFGLGSETRRTETHIPDPFGIETGNPKEMPEGFEEKWLVNVHAIDTRGAEDKLGCTECKCELYNVTVDEYGKPLGSDYKGGLLCCPDYAQCKLKEGFDGPKRSLYLRYTVKWIDWDDSVVPVKIYVLDVTDTLKLSDNSEGINSDHNCKLEYQVDSCRADHNKGNGCVHVRKTSVPLQTGGYVIYAVGHQHSGGIGTKLYGQDGRVICSSIPIYGNGNEAGNESGHIVGMSSCYPKPGSMKIFDGETLTLESNYNSTMEHVGVMGLIYILVAEQLPFQPFTHSTRSSFFMDSNNMLLDN